jgi:integrase
LRARVADALGRLPVAGDSVAGAGWRAYRHRQLASRHWTPALAAAGVRDRRIYDLRHIYATWSLARGVDIFTLARRMGSSVWMIDRTYGHLVTGADEYERELLDASDQGGSRPVGRYVDAEEALDAA